MNRIDQYSELFKTDYSLTDEAMRTHISRFQLLDKLLPPSSTFFMITNTNKGNYEFISNNLEFATGLSKTEVMEKGIPFFLSLIHPEEIASWMQIIKDLMEFYMINYVVEDLKKLEFQYNYRLRVNQDRYLNILENQVNLIADDVGKPIVGLGHFTVFGQGKTEPMKAVARYLNENNEYETVFKKIYGSKMLEQGISNREKDILQLLVVGLTSSEVAAKLFISEHTVKTHRKNMMAKCDVKNMTELIVKCIREGII